VSLVKYELGFYNPEDDILHSHRRENIKSYIAIILRIRLQTGAQGKSSLRQLQR
jgi:hypothetical protein